MVKKQIIKNRTGNAHQNGGYLERPRLHTLLKNAMNYPVVVVCAGSGYGKTYTVHSFLKEEYDALIVWQQISELDNSPARFWESFTKVVLQCWPEFGARLVEMGFPETDEAFAKYCAIRYETTTFLKKQVRVFDDFHLLKNPAVLRFFGRLRSMSPPDMTVILISRTMPQTPMIHSNMHERIFMIQEDALCFTEDEISRYFSQLNLSITNGEVRNIYDDTQGWAFAINLIGRSLAKKGKYERYALDAMKKNIFRLIDAEIPLLVSGPLWRFLLHISLIDLLAASLVKVLAVTAAVKQPAGGANGADELIKEMEQLSAYIRYDNTIDTYMIHHLLRDYLRQKQEQILTEEERKETYQTAARWCEENGYHTDALSYYEKSADYDTIVRMIASLNVEISSDMAQYALDIFNNAPETARFRNPLFLSMYLKLKINLGQFEEAHVFAEQYIKDYEVLSETSERNRALTAIYASWGAVRTHMCTHNDVYDFDIYYKKMNDYFDKNPFTLIGTYKLTSSAWASLVGTNRAGAMEEYTAAVSRATPYLSHVMNGFYCGFEELVCGELCFYRREFNNAEQYFKQSVDKAILHDQYVTHNRALVFLMHIDFIYGDFISAAAKLREMEALLNEKDYGVRYTIYDIACGFYHFALEQPQQMPEWLKGDFSLYTHSSFMENYANRVKIRYHYQTRKYAVLLAFIENALKHPLILFGQIELRVIQALIFYQLKRRDEAIAALTEAYKFAESNRIVASFTEYGKDMRTLTAAALRDNTCTIPRKWLEDINRISSSYAKRKTKMLSEYRRVNNLEEKINLTDREIDILKALSDGFSRIEIASSRNISVNTVKMAINIIYEKLCVFSLPEAIRIAADHKLI